MYCLVHLRLKIMQVSFANIRFDNSLAFLYLSFVIIKHNNVIRFSM